MYGIGKKTAPKLIKVGINTIGDLAKSTDLRVKKYLVSFTTPSLNGRMVAVVIMLIRSLHRQKVFPHRKHL